MKLKQTPILLLIGLLAFVSCKEEELNTETNIIPNPQEITFSKGSFAIDGSTKILYAPNLKSAASALSSGIEKEFNKKLEIAELNASAKNIIVFEHADNMANEEYIVVVESKKIVCKASTAVGAFYAAQSIIQAAVDNNGKLKVPCLTIKDNPRFAWRGFMLDEARHFFGKETVLQYLDIMAKLKLNRFHWHLTDEQAWRIEIKKYPLLTEIGSSGSWSDAKAPKAFYTQEDIKEIVEYAHQRHIMVIPEIDMPGHATAAARSYPEISGGGTGRWKDFTFNPVKETTYEFISDIFTEIATLFPDPYIHIGADEVHYGNQSWFTDREIQKFIKQNNLTNELGLEHYFVRRATDIVKSKGKTMIGWDEIVNSGVTADSTIAMWWRHDKPKQLSLALENKFNVILTPRIPCYFDFVQDSTHKIGRRWGGNFNQLETVYNFPANIDDLIKGYDNQVLGMQANVWTERIKDKDRLDFMVYPRLLALAEAAWTKPEQKNYADFERRTKQFFKYLDLLKVKYFNPFDKESTPEPWGPEKADVIAEG